MLKTILRRPFRGLSTFLVATATWPLLAQGTPIGFVEQFALAPDRGKTLDQLIPGTEDHYDYQCRVYQQGGDFDRAGQVLQAWQQRHGRTTRFVTAENRQALLTYERSPDATLAHLRRQLDLHFDHQPVLGGQSPDLPARLDPALISLETLTTRALGLHRETVAGFTDAALPMVAASQLDDDRLMDLLGRLRHPDVPNLPALVVRNLGHRRSRGFGALPIHRALLLAQLEECARLRRDLLGVEAFHHAYLRRLRPGADVQWVRDPVARLAYLERLQAFADRLSPAANSLKVHVLHHRLRHDLATGTLDRDRLLAYLRLPRPAAWANGRYLQRHPEPHADLQAQFPTGFAPVGDDQALVRACLAHFLRDADSAEAFAETVDNDWLRRLFAETKILAGAGDMERWYSLLNDPAYYEQLEQRVEIEFAPTQATWFGSDEAVALDVEVKNVPTLLVRVFAIHALNYYREKGKEVDAAIDVDGLVANVETTHTFAESPLRRVRRHFELPALAKPGVYVVELVGNGTASRAVLHKGRLQYTERTSAAGHALVVRDENGTPVPGASAYFGGRQYTAGTGGEIVIPYSTAPAEERLILAAGDLATLTTLRHRREDYALGAEVHVDRETLLARGKASVLVRPSLLLNGAPVSLALVEQPVLTIVATDLHGVVTAEEVRDFALHADRESVQEITVLDGLVGLTVTLRGRVRSLTRNEPIELASGPATFAVNGIEPTDRTACPLLGRTPDGYVLDVRGKEGEAKAGRAVQLVLQHRLFADPVHVTLATDAQGRIHLGPLPGIVSIRASGFPDDVGTFVLHDRGRTYPRSLHAVAGATLRVPYLGSETTTTREVASFLELRDNEFTRDAFDRLALAEGFVELRDLAPGDYDLWLREADVHVDIRVTAGKADQDWAVGRDRLLQLAAPPLHIVRAAWAGADLSIQLAHAGPRARVHVFAGRYLPAFDPFLHLRGSGPRALAELAIEHGEATYHAGRDIGEEYRYILERRFATRFPGNMLRRPSLLLNPWALEETVTAIGTGGSAGSKFGGRGGRANAGPASPAPNPASLPPAPGTFPNLDFLPQPARVLANLRADDQGVLHVPAVELGDGQLVYVVATDGEHTVGTSLVRPERPLVPRSRRLREAIAAERHVVEQRRIELVAAGGTATLADGTSAKAQTYDSLDAVFGLLAALNPGAELARFSFVLGWPELAIERKRALYSEHACHELHFFLHQKDPEFFAAEVRPFLANKRHRTFLDDWLLAEDLARYLDPRAFERLNAAERILLARRLPSAAAAVRRRASDQLDLASPDLERLRLLFETALQSGRLAGTGGVAATLETIGQAAVDKGAFDSNAWNRSIAPTARAGGAGRKVADRAAAEPPAERTAEAEEEPAADKPRAEEKRKDEQDVTLRQQQRALYRAPDPTRRFVEHDYWHRKIEEQDAELVPMNAFWRDFAEADPAAPFCSVHVAEASHSFAEMMLALAVLDLPFRPRAHETTVDGPRVTLRAASPLLLVRKELVDAAPAGDAAPILVNENFFRLDDRYRFVGNERRDAFVTGEFLVDTVYGCQVVVTNPTSTPRRVEVLLQVPQGAIPVRASASTRGVSLALQPFGTAAVEYCFYFPQPGPAPHYPVHVVEAGRLVAFATPRTLPVVSEPSEVDTSSWQHVAQQGGSAAVLAFLDGANLLRLDLGQIAWRMKDRAFYTAVLTKLRDRLVYDDVLWSYSILHGDVPAIREYLRHADRFLAACGRWLASPLLDIEPVERRTYQHVEFEPLVNPRAHRFGRRREILNPALAAQYHAFLAILADRPRLDDADWLGVTYYLLLQDRVEEALASFAKVDPGRLPTRIQYDYTRAYLGFFAPEQGDARAIAASYADHPVAPWRARFREVLAQLDEAEGKARADGAGDPAARQDALAGSEPALELVVEGRRVVLHYRNVAQCTVSYYPMDVELLFSTRPFVQQDTGAFAHVRPRRSDVHTLPADASQVALDLPAELASTNVLIEVQGGGIARRAPYYPTSLTTQFLESYGQVRVTDSADGKPLSRVYVKVFARLQNGQVRFHKDGYTDLRGRFDYASLSGEGAASAQRYAVLVLSDDRGALIREVNAPQR